MKIDTRELLNMSAYGGERWSPRRTSLREEIGAIWEPFGQVNEWSPLKSVLLHRPGPELNASRNPDEVQMLATVDPARAAGQHDGLVRAYREAGVQVAFVDSSNHRILPNQMFVADVLFMTPQGAILARPASTVRAGEERWVARRLAGMGIPLLRSIVGRGIFEGADALWLDSETVMLARGARTDADGAAQVALTLKELGVDVIQVNLPKGAMHLMGSLRFADRDLALAWPDRLDQTALNLLSDCGYRVRFIPDEKEAILGFALNFVTLGPRQILMADGNPKTRAFYESLGIHCRTVPVDEIAKAAGAIGCLTGIIAREMD